MGDEQQPRSPRCAGVVERGDHGLARAGGRDDEVAVAAVRVALRGQGLEDLLLVRVGADLQPRDDRRRRLAPERRPQPLGVERAGRVVGDERRIGPVAVEGPLELAHQVRRRDRRQPHVPLQPVDQRRPREVAAADERRGVAGVAVEEPGLGVQAGRAGLVADPDLGAVAAHQLVHGALLGRLHVGRGDHAERDAAGAQRVQLVGQHADAVPADERAQQVDAVGRAQLGPQLGTERRFLGRVGEQRGRRQRGRRPLQPVHPRCDLAAEHRELLVCAHPLPRLRDPVEQPVDQRQPLRGIAQREELALDGCRDVPGEHVRRVGRLDTVPVRGEVRERRDRRLQPVGAQRLVHALGQRVGHAGIVADGR